MKEKETKKHQFEVGAAWKERCLKSRLALMVALAWSVYTLCYLFNVFSYLEIPIESTSHRALSAGLIALLVFLLIPLRKDARKDKLLWHDILFLLATAIGCGFIIIHASNLVFEKPRANTAEMILGIMTIVCFVEATRRTVGSVIAVIVGLSFFYPAYSGYFPGFLHGRGRPFSMVIAFDYLHGQGMWGIVIGVVSTVVAGFIIFASFLKATGASRFFNDLALATTGWMTGGAAKSAVIGSTLFGTISGSIAACVATVGPTAIPMMKESGYTKNFSGAVTAAAGVGSMFMPPVMGATAFLIAEFLSMSYWKVCVAAFLPAFIFYLVLFVQVHLEAKRKGIQKIPRKHLPSLKETLLNGWQYLLPFVVLMYFLAVLRYSAATSIMFSLVSLIAVSFFRKESRLTFSKLMIALEDSARGMLAIAPLCTAIGLLVGALMSTGAATSLAADLLGVTGGNLLFILLLAGSAAFVLGMGMTSVTVYIVTVTLMAPALIQAGIEPIAAHMFLFYLGCLSFITPPVAIAAYIASGISGGNPFSTGFAAMRLAVVGFLVPFVFTFHPGLLAVGSATDIISSFVFVGLGLLAVGVALAGYLFTGMTIWERIMIAVGGGCMFLPMIKFQVIGALVLFMVVILQLIKKSRKERSLDNPVLTNISD